jgi:glycerol uptake facilitator protein
MTPFIAEIIGTMLMILLGNGVVANVVLTELRETRMDCYYNRMGICRFIGVVVAGPVSGAHLNPIVTLGLALVGKFAWSQVATYVVAQPIGAMLGAFLVWLFTKIILPLLKMKAEN